MTFGLSVFLAFFYVFKGRFHKTAFIRKVRFYVKQSEQFQRLAEKMEGRYIDMCIKSEVRKESRETNKVCRKVGSLGGFLFGALAALLELLKVLRRVVKGILFALVAIGVFVIATLLFFIKTLWNVLFKVLIMWRQMHLFQYLNITISFPYILETLIHSIVAFCPAILRTYFHYVFFPITWVFTFLANINIDLSGINVTCKVSTSTPNPIAH